MTPRNSKDRREASETPPERDLIAGIVTPPGEGGLGGIRLAGQGAAALLKRIFSPEYDAVSSLEPFRLYYGYIIDKDNTVVDEVTAVIMPEGRSYTGQEQAEIFCHGGQFVLRKILQLILSFEVRAAEPGEFTRRAFLSGRIDLAKAEAVAELIGAKTEYAYRSARKNLLGEMSDYIDNLRDKAVQLLAELEAWVDYPEEKLETAEREKLLELAAGIIEGVSHLAKSYRSGKIIREGYKIAIAGRPNAGKSSLFNLLLNQNRAIVAPIPGTTRDYLTEWIDIEGFAVSLTDTAGLRETSGVIEKAGQKAAEKIMEESDLILWINDLASRNHKRDLAIDINKFRFRDKVVLIWNKSDLIPRKKAGGYTAESPLPGLEFSCRTKKGLEKLKEEIISRLTQSMPDLTERLVVTSERHKKKLDTALKAFRVVKRLIEKDESFELVSFELRQGINAIDEITGRIYNDEILDRIFSQFCIGK